MRGLVVRRSDESVMHFRDTVRRHFVASISTADAAARNRQKLLEDFYAYGVTAVEEGRREQVREYVLPRARDGAATDKLAAILVEQGIDVMRATAPFRAGGREFPVGTYVVPLAQRAKRLVRTLLDPVTAMDEQFTKKEEDRRRRRLRSEIYDVTAWSLPLMFNVEAVACAQESQGSFTAATAERIRPGEVRGTGQVAYVVPWGSAAAGRFLAAALRQDLKILSSDKPFTVAGAKHPAGSLIVKVSDNPPGLRERLVKLAAASGANVVATDTSWVEEGVNFGSRWVARLKRPAIAMAWDQPASANAAGATRFVIERQYGYPVTPIRTSQLSAADLRRFHVVIFPPGGNYAQILGPAGVERIKAFVEAGGTVIGLAEAVSFLSDPKVGLLAVSQESAFRETDPKKPEGAKPQAGAAPPPLPGKLYSTDADYEKAIQAEREPPDAVPGILARARLDAEHWITAGMGDSVYALVAGRAIYTPIKLDKGVNAAYFEAPEKLLASGYLWAENRRQLAYKPLVIVQPRGRGNVVGFTEDPNYRAYMDGMNLLFMNAIFRGPVHVRPFATAAEE